MSQLTYITSIINRVVCYPKMYQLHKNVLPFILEKKISDEALVNIFLKNKKMP